MTLGNRIRGLIKYFDSFKNILPFTLSSVLLFSDFAKRTECAR